MRQTVFEEGAVSIFTVIYLGHSCEMIGEEGILKHSNEAH